MNPIRPKVIIKIGGSTIASGERPCTFHPRTARRLMLEIAEADVDFMLVHGAGSYGHPKARKYGLKEGYDPKRNDQLIGVSEVQHDMRDLNLQVIKLLYKYGCPAGMVPPGLVARCKDGKIKRLDTKPFESFLAMGIVPVTFGDVVPDDAQKFCVVSGDEMMVRLAKAFGIRKAIFVTNVDGVFTELPSKPSARLIPVVRGRKDLPRFGKVKGDNITRQMEGKARCALKMASGGTEVLFINGARADRLANALAGKKVTGTLFPAKKRGGGGG